MATAVIMMSTEEYQELSEKAAGLPLSKTKLQKLCTKICNEMPVNWGWGVDAGPKPWGCIITANEDECEWYCDSCPVSEICPYDKKQWSK